MSEYVFSCGKIDCCKHCPYCRYDFDKGSHICVIFERVIEVREVNKRAEDCPLKELPEKHGRLIDADELENDYKAIAVGNEFYEERAERIAKTIANAPTILEASEEWNSMVVKDGILQKEEDEKAKTRYGEVLDYRTADEALIGGDYIFSDELWKISEHPEEFEPRLLAEVFKGETYPFAADRAYDERFQFCREVLEGVDG